MSDPAKSDAYDAAFRENLRGVLIGNSVDPARAGTIANLACDASDRAMEALMAECGKAQATGDRMMAIELASQLARERAQAIFKRVHAIGRGLGLPVYANAVTTPA